MELRFYWSGSLVFTTEADIVPPVGAEVVFRMQTYKKGVEEGAEVVAKIDGDVPIQYDYSIPGQAFVVIAVNELREVKSLRG